MRDRVAACNIEIQASEKSFVEKDVSSLAAQSPVGNKFLKNAQEQYKNAKQKTEEVKKAQRESLFEISKV